MSAETEPRSAPYASAVSIQNYLTHLAGMHPLPTRVDKSVMSHLNYGTQKALVASLRAFGLLDDKDAPTDRLERLVQAVEAERVSIFREAMEDAYPYLFTEGAIDLTRATPAELEEQVRAGGKVNGDTLRKSVSLFITLAADAGITLSPHLTARKAPIRRTSRGRSRRAAPEPQEPSPPTPPLRNGHGGDPWLSKFPDFDPSWPDALKTKWFAGFERLMKSRDRSETQK